MPPKWDTVLEVIFGGFPVGVRIPHSPKVEGDKAVSGALQATSSQLPTADQQPVIDNC